MQSNTNLSFAAIITIELPGSEEATQLRVKLLPADQVPVGGGRTKPLQDCTLAELQQFAETLESKLWDQLGSRTLIDLVVGGEAEINFRFAEEQMAESQPDKLWLEHALIFPDGKADEQLTALETRAMEDGNTPVETVSTADGSPDPLQGESDEKPEGEVAADRAGVQATPDIEADEKPVDQPVSEQETHPDLTPLDEVLDELLPVEDKAEKVEVIEEHPPVEGIAEMPEAAAIQEEEAKVGDEAAQVKVVERPLRVLGLRRPLNHPTWTAVDILANESAFRHAQAHAMTSLDREVAGVLIGPQPEEKPDGRYIVHVADTIIARHTRMHGASVTYTPESWRYISDKLAEKYPDDSAVIVGWYHTHPGFGIFLSGMDLFIHQNFFTQKWHIALVLDPRARRSGFFCWDREMTKVDAYQFPWPK